MAAKPLRISFIGLGAMGLPMAKRLSQADGIELKLFDVSQKQLDLAKGLGKIAKDFNDAVHDTDIIFTVVPADVHVDSLAKDLAAADSDAQLFVDFSTVSPQTIEAAAERLEAVNLKTVSVALTRSTAAAQAGTLGLFVGGNEDLIERIRPALNAMATDVRYTGGLGTAKAVKLANNMVVSSVDITIIEAIVLGARYGMTPTDVVEALRSYGVTSWPLENHIAIYVLPDDLGPGRFSTLYMAKDVGLYGKLAQSQGVPSFFAATINAYYRGTVAHGHGNDYHMIVLRWLEKGANSADYKVEGGEPDTETVRTIARGVQAVQTLITLETLGVLVNAGIPLHDAAGHFETGSSGTHAVQRILHGGGDAEERVTYRSLIEDLEKICALAAKTSTPALMFEIAKQVAVNQARVGLDEDVYAGTARPEGLS